MTWIDAAVSEKPELTDGRTTDACATTVALLTKSIRPKKLKPHILLINGRSPRKAKLFLFSHAYQCPNKVALKSVHNCGVVVLFEPLNIDNVAMWKKTQK